MPRAWNDKRERQYEHIKQGLEKRGKPDKVAEEIAARTVNKERAQHGEAREASRSSTDDMPAGRRGGTSRRSTTARWPERGSGEGCPWAASGAAAPRRSR